MTVIHEVAAPSQADRKYVIRKAFPRRGVGDDRINVEVQVGGVVREIYAFRSEHQAVSWVNEEEAERCGWGNDREAWDRSGFAVRGTR